MPWFVFGFSYAMFCQARERLSFFASPLFFRSAQRVRCPLCALKEPKLCRLDPFAAPPSAAPASSL